MKRPPSVCRRVRSFSTWVILAVVLCASAEQRLTSTTRGAAQAASPTDKVDALFESWNRKDSPGCAVGISRNGATVYENGYGMASLENGVSITAASVFHVASVSKQFTAASILLLAKAGTLALDDEVRKFIPAWEGDTPVTVRQLLNHTSGLRDAFLLTELAASHDGSLSTHDRLVGLLARQRGLNFPPGSEYAYNNGGYLLLAEIVKRVTGQSLRAYAEANIFKPLDMTHTHFHDDASMIVPDLARGYSRDGHGLHVARAPDGMVGNAGLFTNVRDLLLWEQNLASGDVGGAALVASMQQPTRLTTGHVSQYGFGLMIGEHRGLRTVSHGGGDPGASAFVVRYPDQGLAVAIACNLDDIDSIALSQQVAEIYLADVISKAPSRETPPTAPSPSPSAAQLAEQEGLYRDASTEGLLRIFVRDGTLRGSSGAGVDGGWPTTPLDANRFSIPGSPITLQFEPTLAGGRNLRVIGERRLPFTLERLRPFTPGVASLAAYTGDYLGAELDTTYSIRSTGTGLVLHISGRKAIALQPIYQDGFAGSLVGVIRFSRGAQRRITGFTLHANGVRGLRFERTGKTPTP